MGRLLTVRQAAEHFQAKQSTIREWLKNGKLKGFKVGKEWRIEQETLSNSPIPVQTHSARQAEIYISSPGKQGEKVNILTEDTFSLREILRSRGYKYQEIGWHKHWDTEQTDIILAEVDWLEKQGFRLDINRVSFWLAMFNRP